MEIKKIRYAGIAVFLMVTSAIIMGGMRCNCGKSSSTVTTTRYSCSSGSCVQDPSGQYTTADCSGACTAGTTKYSCSGSSCVQDPSGQYTASNCNNACTAVSGCTVTTAVQTTSVTIADYSFTPSCIKVTGGQTVTWTNNGPSTHTVTSDPGAPETFNSGNLSATQTFSFAFTTTGTTTYHCAIHPIMKATVIVQ